MEVLAHGIIIIINEKKAQVNSNTKAAWVEQVREEMKELVPERPKEGFQLGAEDAGKKKQKEKLELPGCRWYY